MITFPLPNEYNCWKCGNNQKPFASLNEQLIEWQCEKCGSSNFVLLNTIHFRIGHRLFLAGNEFLKNNEPDIAAILFYSSVDASLSRGIFELENWKSLKKNESPKTKSEIVRYLSRINFKQKIKKYEDLAGIKIDELIEKLIFSKEYKNILINVSSLKLKNEFENLSNERHKIIHYGEDVNEEIIKSSLIWIQKIILIIDLLYDYQFKKGNLNKRS